jgi:hypothetical protein
MKLQGTAASRMLATDLILFALYQVPTAVNIKILSYAI